jgi:hypothetical protein
LIGAAGVLRAIFGGAKNSYLLVTSWAPNGTKPVLTGGTWVMLGGATKSNFLRSGLFGPKFYPQTMSFSAGGSQSAFTPITALVLRSRVGWPRGVEKWKGLLGQRQLKY